MEEKRFAVLIDAENIAAKYIGTILDEISNYGIITYKRIYGDWTKDGVNSWKNVLLNYSILPIQQYSYTTGKNATDSAMIIDAMDILYSNKVEGFCIVSSDSDFTRLANRLRESGMMVIGMGEKKTPHAFSKACNAFKYIEVLYENEIEECKISEEKSDVANTTKSMTSMKIIRKAILQMIGEIGDEEKGMNIGEIGTRLIKRYPDFDVRNYEYSKLSKMLEGFSELEVCKSHVKLLDKGQDIKNIERIISMLINKTDNKQLNMGTLSQQLLEKVPKFNTRKYGYTKFAKMIEDLKTVQVVSTGKNGSVKIVKLKK